MGANSLPVRSDRKFLSREIIPFRSELTRGYGNLSVITSNPDPVLLYLAQGDERAYRTMERNDPAVSSGREKRENNLLSSGFSIKRGSSKLPASKRLHLFTIDWFKRIKALPEVRKRVFDGLCVGWRPLENTFTYFDFKGKTYGAPTIIREKDQECFRFTTDRDIAHFDRLKNEYVIFDNPIARLKWFTSTYGSTNNPYGVGVYQKAFLPHFARDKFFEMFSQGMQRSMGMIKAKQTGLANLSGPAASKATDDIMNGQDAMNNVVSDIQQILDTFNSQNILLEKAGWVIDFLNNVSFADGWIKALEYVDKQITLIVATEMLSFQEAQYGSRAQAVVHADSGNKTSMNDGGWFDSVWNDCLINPVLAYNFGEIDPDDLPKHLSHCRIPLTLTDIKVAYDMGMPLDADEIARRFYLPLADEDTTNILKLPNPVKKTGPNPQNPGGDPKKQVTKADEKTRKNN